MKRTIVQPADLSGAALSELKQWLGITRPDEDAQLTGLLQASHDMCEAFIRQLPVECGCEEVVEASGQWAMLSSRPVRAITGVETLAIDGTRSPLSSDHYAVEIDAEGRGKFRLTRTITDDRLVISFVVGIAPDWPSLPDSIRQGMIRLAAFQYRDRDTTTLESPPASIAALLRPWRVVGLT
ncbi:phage head-tail connector protein [Erythrobacteraceae bacterium E2-1 Yellow Sea]|nr:phage head-tail connector protein [Erythrobacteraceae bacterium E2-1 Yellow Sea]